MQKLKRRDQNAGKTLEAVPRTRRAHKAIADLFRTLCEAPGSSLTATEAGSYSLGSDTCGQEISATLVRLLLARGLLAAAEGGGLTPTAEARSWLTRQDEVSRPFVAQHHRLEMVAASEAGGGSVLINCDESPVAGLMRHKAKDGAPWLAMHLFTAAERLRRDFELGQLQPRITANWSATINMDRRSGDGGLTSLTDMALAARLRVDRAIDAVGPEFAGLLIDVCCFLKRLEAVERERLWPARSAKLVLRLALEALARHYGLEPQATGKAGGRKIRHWGGEGYRPEAS